MSQFDIVRRTLCIQTPAGTGTTFALDVEGCQYLITAKHLVSGPIDTYKIAVGKQWLPLVDGVIGLSADAIDIAVLRPTRNIPFWVDSTELGNLEIETDPKLAQEVLFFGFPHRFATITSLGHPVAYVKEGIISGFTHLESGHESLFVAGHSNPGFSGGPVFVKQEGGLLLSAVLVDRQQTTQPVYGTDNSGNVDTKNIIGYTSESVGIFRASNIQHALELISANPSGHPI